MRHWAGLAYASVQESPCEEMGATRANQARFGELEVVLHWPWRSAGESQRVSPFASPHKQTTRETPTRCFSSLAACSRTHNYFRPQPHTHSLLLLSSFLPIPKLPIYLNHPQFHQNHHHAAIVAQSDPPYPLYPRQSPSGEIKNLNVLPAIHTVASP